MNRWEDRLDQLDEMDGEGSTDEIRDLILASESDDCEIWLSALEEAIALLVEDRG